jgi:hypothetical protein
VRPPKNNEPPVPKSFRQQLEERQGIRPSSSPSAKNPDTSIGFDVRD